LEYLATVGPVLGAGILECAKKAAPCNLSQNMATVLLAQNITGTVMEILATNKSVSELVSTVDQKVKAENTGPLQDLFGGLSGLIGSFGMASVLPCIISCVICILLIVGFVMLGQSPAGQAAITTAVSKVP
jgi:hypothetical protein